jgi:hypothetical protein
MKIFLICFFNIVFIQGLFSQIQNDTIGADKTDTLYYKFEAINAGLYFTSCIEALAFDYPYTDTSGLSHDLHFPLNFTRSGSIGGSVKFKYGSVNFNISPLTNAINENNHNELFVFESRPVKRSFSFSLYPNRFSLTAGYTRINGFLYNDYFVTTESGLVRYYKNMSDFRFDQIVAGGNFYFNKKFSFSKSNSWLYFPKKSLFTWMVGANFKTQKMVNGDESFVPYFEDKIEGDTIYRYYTWDHVKEARNLQFSVMPGIEFFLTRNTIKKGKAKVSFFYHMMAKAGPSFIQSDIICQNPVYNENGIVTGICWEVKSSYGLLFGNFILMAQSDLRNSKFTTGKILQEYRFKYRTLTLSYLIPSKKLYGTVDAKIKNIRESIF